MRINLVYDLGIRPRGRRLALAEPEGGAAPAYPARGLKEPQRSPVGPTALITDVAWDDLHREQAVLSAAGIEAVDGRAASDAELAHLARSADAILTCWRPVDAAMLEGAERCVTVARYGVGLDNIDVDAATELGMVVTNVPDYCFEEVSDHTLALLLAHARRIPAYRDETRSGGWDRNSIGPLRRLSSQTIGLVGYGRIGRRVAEKASAFGMRVLASAPSREPGTTEVPVEFVGLADLLAQSDYVSLHAPLSAATRHLLGPSEFAAMRPGAYLINTARGGLVDTAALVAALESGRLAGAGLDVLESEPPDPADVLRRIESVTLTPHAAFDSEDAVHAVATRAAHHAVAVLAGEVPETIVNPEVLGRENLRLPKPGAIGLTLHSETASAMPRQMTHTTAITVTTRRGDGLTGSG